MLVLTGWNWEPWIVASLALASFGYAVGIIRLRQRSATAGPVGSAQVAAFGAGIFVLFVVLLSPLDAIADQLFWVHMVQHLGLMLFAAPLLVLARPAIVFLWAFDTRRRKQIAGLWTAFGSRRAIEVLMQPVLVWLLFCGAFVVWHFPGPYQSALGDEAVHTLEHLCLFVSALMFWSIVIEPSGRRRLAYGPTLVFLVTAAVLSSLPGALIALAPRPLYPAHAAGDAAWGLTLLEDQQLAGIIMWIPGGVIYLVAVSAIFLKWLQQAERQRPLARGALLLVPLVCTLSPLLGGCGRGDGHDPAGRGAILIRHYGCGGCHTIPGIADATGVVGPPLSDLGRRIYIAGFLRNTPDNLVIWLQNPQRVVPGNVMPNMNIGERDARDLAAFLDTLQ